MFIDAVVCFSDAVADCCHGSAVRNNALVKIQQYISGYAVRRFALIGGGREDAILGWQFAEHRWRKGFVQASAHDMPLS